MGWNRFFSQVQRDLKFWLFGMAFFTLFRACLIMIYSGELAQETSAYDFINTFLNGMRFDSMVVCFWIIPSFLLSIACGFKDWTKLTGKVRGAMAILFAFLTTIICAVDVGFYREFRDQFNYMVLGVWYDDAASILQTIWRTHPVLWCALAIGVIGWLTAYGLRRWLKNGFVSDERMESFRPHAALRIILTAMVVVGFGIGIRGSFGRTPARLKGAAVTQDLFLNKCTMNPARALVYAVKHHFKAMGGDGLKVFIPDGDLRAAMKRWDLDSGGNDLDACMQRSAAGPKGVRPRHIFLIVMESCEAWPMYEEYAELKMADGLKRSAKEGLWVRHFLPGSYGTMTSMAIFMAGLPDAGLVINYQARARQTFPTSIAPIFKNMGYLTRVFRGGFLSWQRFGDFAHNQGFDEVWGGGHMGSWRESNEWGVDDEFLFKFILGKLDDSKPTFNLILTMSHHPPFDVNVEDHKITELPESIRDACQDDVDLNRMAHYAYTDHEMEKFVRAVIAKEPEALFACTGDHVRNYYIKRQPSPLEQASVPLILYGPEVLRGLKLPDNVAGSHMDIIPTLIELAAPKGFSYRALGNDLLAPRPRFAGIARFKVITADAMYFLGPPEARTLPLSSGADQMNLAWREEEVRSLHDTIHGIGWWRIKNGPLLK